MNFTPKTLDFKPVVLLFTHGRNYRLHNKPFYGLSIFQKIELNKNLKAVENVLSRQKYFPVIEFNRQKQVGVSFGERLAGAYRWAFQQGYTYVITVGDDCPELKSIHWQSLYLSASEGKLVAGPDLRGGMYLIGVSKKDFDYEQFKNLKWQTGKLFVDFTNHFEKKEIVQLERHADINSLPDLFLLKGCKKSRVFIDFLLIPFLPSCDEILNLPIKNRLFNSPVGRKAPPAYIFS